jgi:predicted signal transduction protein with EAL and GGDEF domain
MHEQGDGDWPAALSGRCEDAVAGGQVSGADRRVRTLRPGDTLARSGGDEFVVLCPNLGEDGALAMAERLQALPP